MKDYFVIGKIVNTQGLKGELRIFPTTDDINRFKLLKEIIVDEKGSLNIYQIENVRFHKQFVLLKLKGIDDINSAEKLKTFEVKIKPENALLCDKDEYYIRDLYDMKVVTEQNEELGFIKDIIFTKANDVYVVKNKEKELLIPAIKQCILNVDIKNKIMTIKLLEGLR